MSKMVITDQSFQRSPDHAAYFLYPIISISLIQGACGDTSVRVAVHLPVLFDTASSN